MRFQNALVSTAGVLVGLVCVTSCIVKSSPPIPPGAASAPVEISKVFRLGEPLAPDKATALNNFKVAAPVAGREVHSLLTDPADTTKPSFLILNEIAANGKISTQAFPVLKPKLIHTDVFHSDDDAARRVIFDPQFSPDGRYLLFKFGDVGSPGLYRLYILDTQTRDLKLVPSAALQYYAVSWSPDGEYIAFADSYGDPRFYDYGGDYEGAMKLYIYGRRTGKLQLVISSSTLRGPWTWKAPHQLLYGSLTPQDEKVFLNESRKFGVDFTGGKVIAWEKISGQPKRTPVVPNVYEYSPGTKQTRLLQKDAYAPVVSPDGKRIAFLGSADREHPSALNRELTNVTNGKFVIVSEYENPNAPRIVLSQHNGLYPHLMWRRDNQSLLVMQRTAPPPHARFEIREWNINQRQSRLTKVLEERDPYESRSDNDPIFRPMSLSADSQSLFLIVDEYHSLGKNRGYENKDILQRINLKTGTITIIGQVRNAMGVGWHEN